MIPRSFITEWREQAPWSAEEYVEQDLVISRALVELFGNGLLSEHLAFRGGTALHKLFLQPAARYSEDIDLVQIKPGPIGPVLDAMRESMRWLEELSGNAPKRDRGSLTAKFTYRFESEGAGIQRGLKLEINTREHFRVHEEYRIEYGVQNRWFSGSVLIPTYSLAELLGTKLRALYSRSKGRDLFDLWLALERTDVDPRAVADCCREYLKSENRAVSGPEFQRNLDEKLEDPSFCRDINGLLRPEIADAYDVDAAAGLVSERLLALLP